MLDAFIAAGYLTEQQAHRPARPTVSSLSAAQLAAEIKRRLRSA
jgi:hypothetical protein